ncbi:hypothetical protein T492DRAFT_602770 [Pavlovales sp. CCMP2436]|nr:hypothetical protein T492DRAFT_602770 [Pavlovales sp. CCMP2436]
MLHRVIVAAYLMAGRSRAEPGFASFSALGGRPYEVGYDARALTRSLFPSGLLHYPRGAPEEWDGWLEQAVESGLNMIEIYVFWNLHVPEEGGEGVWSGGAKCVLASQPIHHPKPKPTPPTRASVKGHLVEELSAVTSPSPSPSPFPTQPQPQTHLKPQPQPQP